MKRHLLREGRFVYQLLLRLLAVLALFSCIRLIFFFHNLDAFPGLSFGQYLRYALIGLRFDWVAITYINAVFILASILPVAWRLRSFYRRLLWWLFLLFNGVAFLVELADIAWFPHAFRRSISSDFWMLEKSANLLPEYAAEYWYLAIVWLLLAASLLWVFKKTEVITKNLSQNYQYQWFIFVLAILFFVTSARGGWQLRPLMPITATEYVQDSRFNPLIANSSLGLIFSMQQRQLEAVDYLRRDELEKHFPLRYSITNKGSAPKKNVIVIVLESFGKAQIGYYQNAGKASNTPFLDSLIGQCFQCTNSFANGLRSTQGIVALASGIPALMDDPLMFSAYQGNRIRGLGHLFNKLGYRTAFFHASNPGSMEFGRFARLAGFEYNFDRTHFPDQSLYDGNWGIWDVPFFNYFVESVDTFSKPFAAMLFSLSSHHPYRVESWFEEQWPATEPVSRSFRYTDEALRQLFSAAAKKEWFANTLWVITADHSGPMPGAKPLNRYQRYQIPILLYDPSQLIVGPQNCLLQQTDILPSILDYIGFEGSLKSFGRSVFDILQPPQYSYTYSEGLFQIMDGEYLLLFDGRKSIAMYQYSKDKKLKSNLLHKLTGERARLELAIKAAIQQHHRAMIQNSWTD